MQESTIRRYIFSVGVPFSNNTVEIEALAYSLSERAMCEVVANVARKAMDDPEKVYVLSCEMWWL